MKATIVVLAVFTVPALISAALYHTRYLQLGRETVLWRWILDFQLAWYIWAALTPLIVWLGRRYRVERENLLIPIAVHTGAAIVMSLLQVWLGVLFSIIVYQEPLSFKYWVDQAIPTTIGRFPSALTVYVVILGISYALDYQRQSRDRAIRAAELQTELNRAKLDALKQQLQPHFLFNTLNSISVLMQKGEITDANRVLNNLSDLLRQVLRREDKQLVTLEEELEFVRRYAEIEHIRYGDRLHVAFHADNDALQVMVPTFILQLLVENAIRHGVAKKADSGKVDVYAKLDNGALTLSVSDDGIGIDSGSFNEGVGISNARSRLRHLYGENHTFKINNNNGPGVTVRLRIPVGTASE